MTGLQFISILIAIAFFIICGIGLLVPLVPGVFIAFLGMLIYAILLNLQYDGIAPLLISGIVSLFSIFVELFCSMIDGWKKRVRPSFWGLVGGLMGETIAFYFRNNITIFIFPIFLTILCEFVGRRDLYEAIKKGIGPTTWFVLSSMMNIFLFYSILSIFIHYFKPL